MSGAVKLLPCPFCGGPAWTPFEDDGVLCTSCASEIEICAGFDILTPVSFWNTRSPDPAVAALEAEVARLREALDSLLSAAVLREYDWAGFEWEARLAIRKANWPFSPAPSEKEAG